MADFRKLLFVLVAVATMFATVASAQPYSCDATAVPTLVRSEGIAELAGDILMVCSGTVPGAGIQANVRVRLNTNVTSNILSGTTTEAILLLNELSGVKRANTGVADTVYQGVKISDTELEFLGVVLAPAGSPGASTIRITNVRANASALGSNATIFATVNITGSTTVPVNNNSLVVADTRPGLKFTVTASNSKNCESGLPFTLKWEEGFASAFRPVGDADAAPNTTPGGAYPNESGFNPTPLTAGSLTSLASIGQATQGTRLMARFSGAPSGVSLSAAQQLTVGTMVLQAVTGTDSNGGGGTVTSGTGTVTITDKLVYEVVSLTNADLATLQTVSVSISVSYSIPGPLGSAMVKGSFAPLSTVFTANATAPEPRFIDNAVDVTAMTVGPCRTILLFPFVSNQGGWDTGLAIANTSADPLSTKNQAGVCKLYYYGDSNGGPAPTSPQTTVSVAAGTVAVGTLSSGGVIPAAPGFQGYIFVICEFQYAHGYAFISDLGATKLAQGYLALIVPDRTSRMPVDSSYLAAPNEGENLGN